MKRWLRKIAKAASNPVIELFQPTRSVLIEHEASESLRRNDEIRAPLLESDRLLLYPLTAQEMITLYNDSSAPWLWENRPYSNPLGLLIDDSGPLRWRVPQLLKDPNTSIWFLRLIVLKSSREVIGHISFHLPPDEEGMIEVGLTIAERHRNHGYAREALAALWTWVIDQPGVRTLRYTVSAENLPSMAVARYFGLHHVGQQMDDIDGPEEIFEISTEEFREKIRT